MPYDITSWYPGQVDDSDILFAFRAPRDIALLVNDGIGYIESNPTAQVTADIEVDGVDIGDVVFATDGTVSFTFSAFTLADGERMEVVLPASGNENLGNVALTFNAEVTPAPSETQLLYDVGGYFPAALPAGVKVIACLVSEANVLISQGVGNVRVAPSDANVTLNILKNTTVVGTVVIATSGLVTVNLPTSGVAMVSGDLLFVETLLPSGLTIGDPIDSTISDLSVNFQGLVVVS